MPNKDTMQNKNKWKPEFISRWLPEFESLGLDPSNHKSPTFIHGDWKIGIEHQPGRAFKSAVLQWITDPKNPPLRMAGWEVCSKSDQEKNWFYRVQLEPSALKALLNELDSIEPTAEDAHRAFEDRVKRARDESAQERRKRLEMAPKKPCKIAATTTIYDRNPDVVAEVLERAKGICQQCGNSAPFKRKSDRTDYLEVHHKIRLADDGEDTVENAIALCPNCHRKAHYG